MLVVENTHENGVGTVHLVTNENFFVAKSSAPLLCVNPALWWPPMALHQGKHLPTTETTSVFLTGIQNVLFQSQGKECDSRKPEY